MIIEVKNLRHVYQPDTTFSKIAIDDINLKIDKGEFIGLIGHSGSGKSTLIQHLNGLLAPTGGDVLMEGDSIFASSARLREVRFKVGLVFQYPEQQLFEETVFKDIAFGPKNMGLPSPEIEKRVREAIELVGIDEALLQKSPFDLSGGQKRRVAIAGVIAMGPSVLILDEPTAGLDPKGRNKILSRIKMLHKNTDMTVILVSHSMEDIANNVERIIVMNEGRVALDGQSGEIFKQGETLNRIGLDVPQVTNAFLRLKQLGYPVRSDIFTIEQAKEEIKRLLRGGVI